MVPILEWIELAVVIGIAIAGMFWKSYFPKYMEEKAKNLASKEDIGLITREVENVKAEINKESRIDELKYKLKYEACMEALSIIDAYFSHTLSAPDGGKIKKQFSSTEDARTCHSKLVLSCESNDLILKFNEIVFGPKEDPAEPMPATDLLNQFRNLVRTELGFGGEIEIDRDRAWFGKLGCEE